MKIKSSALKVKFMQMKEKECELCDFESQSILSESHTKIKTINK